jgi:hypothetical protein
MVRWEDWRNCWRAVRRMSISRREREVRIVVWGGDEEDCCGGRSWVVVFGVEVGWRLREERLLVRSGSREA